MVGRGARGPGRREISVIDFMARHDLVDRFRLDHPGREMWLDSSPSVRTRSYLDRVFVRKADTDFIKNPSFHKTVHWFVRVSLRLADRLSLASYWEFNTYLLEIRDFRDQLESLVQRTLVGAVTGKKWWGSLRYRIRDFAIKYGHQFNLDRTKMAKSVEEKLSRVVEGGDSLAIDLARRDLEHGASERYKGYLDLG